MTNKKSPRAKRLPDFSFSLTGKDLLHYHLHRNLLLVILQADDIHIGGEAVANALSATSVDLLLHHLQTKHIVNRHCVVGIVAVLNDKLMVGTPDLDVGFLTSTAKILYFSYRLIINHIRYDVRIFG